MAEHEQAEHTITTRPKSVVIHIDHDQFRVPTPTLTGIELRALPEPDVAADRDVWQEVPGGTDVRIDDDDTVHLKNGMHFFTAPREINPGHNAASG